LDGIDVAPTTGIRRVGEHPAKDEQKLCVYGDVGVGVVVVVIVVLVLVLALAAFVVVVVVVVVGVVWTEEEEEEIGTLLPSAMSLMCG
jgi:Flp pilus assembly protein TadB